MVTDRANEISVAEKESTCMAAPRAGAGFESPFWFGPDRAQTQIYRASGITDHWLSARVGNGDAADAAAKADF